MRQRVSSLVTLFLTGCIGIQGGSEGEEAPKCVYETVALGDPDMTPAGFERSPRELLRATTGRFVGRLANGLSVVLQVDPDFSDLRALYAENEDEQCGPHLASSAVAKLSLDAGGEATGAGTLELRWGEPLASLRFEASPESSLAAAAPTFSAVPVQSPTLDVWLTNFATAGVNSEWRWSAFVPCGSGQQCTGIPGAAGQVTTGEEVSWGKAKLQSE